MLDQDWPTYLAVSVNIFFRFKNMLVQLLVSFSSLAGQALNLSCLQLVQNTVQYVVAQLTSLLIFHTSPDWPALAPQFTSK